MLVTGNGGNTATFDLFDSESGQDLTLSPQTFTSSTEAFINDNSDSLGVPGDADTGRLFHDSWTCVDVSVPIALSTEYQVQRSYLMRDKFSTTATELLSQTEHMFTSRNQLYFSVGAVEAQLTKESSSA